MHAKTQKGYFRYAKDDDGKLRFEHCIIWEKHNGPIPYGMFVHHIDGDKTNNTIDNLSLVTPLEHKRIHSGCKMIDGEWYKPCKICGEYKKCTPEFWYYSRGSINGRICRTCFSAKQVSDRRERVKSGWKRKR